MLDWFDQFDISLNCLLTWMGVLTGLLLLVGHAFLGGDLAEWGLGTLMISCTYSGHRSMAARDSQLREAFEMGQDHERGERQLHSTR